MSTKSLPLCIAVAAFAAESALAGSFSPTTTLDTETGNNTSAADSFVALSNGDAQAANVSKISIHSLAPSGFTGKFFAHYMPWWGNSGHRNIGYSSQDSSQIKKIVADIKSRGYDGVVLAEANTSGYDEKAATMFAPVANAEGLSIIASENHLDSASSPTSQLMADMKYFESNYFNLSNYYRINGRPVVMVFDNDSSINWNKASADAAGSPLFIYRGQSALSNSNFFGGFSWFGGLNSGESRSASAEYLDSFYKAALGEHSGRFAAGDFWKGFNDKLAPWTQDRVVEQQCGQTWVQSLGALSHYYSGSDKNDLPLVQVATWDDYEEGTEVETGIDNCGSVSASFSSSNNTLNFDPSFSSSDGNENTVDHYEVYASQDGVKLMLLSELPVGTRSFNLGNSGLPPGAYKFYVKMVGLSHIINHMSNAVSVTLASGGAASSAPVPSPTPSSTSSAGIVISSPKADSSVESPVHLVLHVQENFEIARIQIWDSVSGLKIDDIKPQSTHYSLDKSFSLKAGVNHTLTITVKDSTMTTKEETEISFKAKAN
jgi:hypothetical protein